MAGNGPAPKEDPVRRNAPTVPMTELEAQEAVYGPELPEGISWHKRTVEWYEAWRRSPQAIVMVDSDWESMIETAVIHTKFWRTAADFTATPASLTNLSAELRRRMAQFGATYEDRLRLRMVIKSPQTQQTEEEEIARAAADAVDYAQRLAEAAANLKKEA